MDLVKNHNYNIKAVQATGYLDQRTKNFKLAGYHGVTLLDVRLEIEENGDIFYYPKKVENITDKRI